jgi:hypothetical protein
MKCFLRKYFSPVFVVLAGVILFYSSCSKDDEVPANPYSGINYNTDTATEQNPDPYSITGLHKNIFNVKCNVPGCHDGTFEPDFRSVQSAYSTLVYQQVNKVTVNNIDSFTYRVVPFDVASSFIHERITTTTPDYMPSNGNRLSPAEINQIDTWIMNGAKDMNGNTPTAPNNLPTVQTYLAYDSIVGGFPVATSRVDSIRYNNVPYNPFVVQQNDSVMFVFFVQDDSTSIQNLQVNQLKFSLDKNNFSSAQVVNAYYAFIYPVWLAKIKVTWPVGTQVYFRYYVKDTDNPATVEFPRTEQPIYYKLYYSFIVQ